MELQEGIKTRRTIRKFDTSKEVKEETIAEIVDLSRYSPTWKNSQTVRYIAIYNKELINQIADECVFGFDHNKGIIKGAPVLMVEVTILKRSGYERDGSFTTSKGTHWESFDAGINCQTFCLSAHEKGLGTVIMGIFDEKEVKRVLELDEDKAVSALIALGYPGEEPICPKRKEVEELLTIKR